MTHNDFWATVNAQLDELETAGTAEAVVQILSHERNPYGPDDADSTIDGFFAGSGGDRTVAESLTAAGWFTLWSEASYYWAMIAPADGSVITYVEGDIYLGDRPTA